MNYSPDRVPASRFSSAQLDQKNGANHVQLKLPDDFWSEMICEQYLALLEKRSIANHESSNRVVSCRKKHQMDHPLGPWWMIDLGDSCRTENSKRRETRRKESKSNTMSCKSECPEDTCNHLLQWCFGCLVAKDDKTGDEDTWTKEQDGTYHHQEARQEQGDGLGHSQEHLQERRDPSRGEHPLILVDNSQLSYGNVWDDTVIVFEILKQASPGTVKIYVVVDIAPNNIETREESGSTQDSISQC